MTLMSADQEEIDGIAKISKDRRKEELTTKDAHSTR